ncbi:alpha-1A adrenergic receptor-like [Asterias amurensis]|uniref:alpha-1A adrenergic receptor-like n=1 Tax=Asterias amurensis TaxID=7602 RepID=UPI003AB31A17
MAALINSTIASDLMSCTFCAYFSYTQRQVLAAIWFLMSFVGVTGNSLVIIAILSSPKLQRVTNYFVFNLSVADLLTSLFIPFTAVAVLNETEWPLPMVLCSITAFILLTCLGCSINNLACIAVNRFVLITKKQETYRRLFSKRRTILAILITWLIPLFTTVVPTSIGYIQLGFEPKYSSCSWVLAQSSNGFVLILFATFCPIQLSVIIYCYIRVFTHIRQHAKKVEPSLGTKTETVSTVLDTVSSTTTRPKPPDIASSSTAKEPKPKRSRLQVQVTINLFLVVCAFILCVVPYAVTLLVPRSRQVFPFAATLFMGNSCLNPIIYAFKHPQFKTVFRCILTGKFSEIPK